LLTGGEKSEYTQALDLIKNQKSHFLIADKGYDAQYLVENAEQAGMTVVIPTRKNKKNQRKVDKYLYKQRNLIERFYNKIKHFRRIATRYDKLASSFMAFLHFAGIYLWIK